MRITNSMSINRLVTNLNGGLNKTNNYYMQLSSNRRIVKLSDDPVGVLSSMTARLNIRNLERYQESVREARSWVDESESALRNMQEIFTSIFENVIDAAGTKNDDDKANIGTYIEKMRDQLQQILNTTVGDKYIFAGFNTTNAPFEKDANGKMLYNGLDLSDMSVDVTDEEKQVMSFEIGYDIFMDVTFTGIDIAGRGENNMFKILDDLVNDLNNGISNEDLSKNYLSKIESLRNRMSTLTVEVGTRTNKLDLMDQRYEEDAINYEAIRTSIEDIDQAETIMKMKLSETIYKQALAVGAKIIQPTLMDFLR